MTVRSFPASIRAHDIDAMRERIADASAERDRQFRDGREHDYLQAYVAVKALELALDEMLAQVRRVPAG